MTSGIYTITAPDGQQYVGSSKNIEKRWAQHRTQLSKGRHYNHRLAEIAKEFGVDRLSFQAVLICTEDDLLIYEQQVIDDLRPTCNLYEIVGTKVAEKDYVKTAFRCPPELYARVVTGAMEARMSINSFIVSLLQDYQDNGPRANLSDQTLDAIAAIFQKVLAEDQETGNSTRSKRDCEVP